MDRMQTGGGNGGRAGRGGGGSTARSWSAPAVCLRTMAAVDLVGMCASEACAAGGWGWLAPAHAACCPTDDLFGVGGWGARATVRGETADAVGGGRGEKCLGARGHGVKARDG
jgi:hypothetical protein